MNKYINPNLRMSTKPMGECHGDEGLIEVGDTDCSAYLEKIEFDGASIDDIDGGEACEVLADAIRDYIITGGFANPDFSKYIKRMAQKLIDAADDDWREVNSQ